MRGAFLFIKPLPHSMELKLNKRHWVPSLYEEGKIGEEKN